MPQDDAGSPESADLLQRQLAELEAENTRLKQELAQAERRSERLRGEMHHRVRNVLAVIRSVARRTALTAGTAQDYAMHLDGRLGAITRAEAMLMRDPEGGVALEEIVAEELLAHAVQEGERVSLSGPAVHLRNKAAEAIGLALHELIVNAVKYGALSASQGAVAITWLVEQGQASVGKIGQVLRLEWRESGVSLRNVPRRKGFGTELIERTLAYELGAIASRDFRRNGVHWTILVPITNEMVAPGLPLARLRSKRLRSRARTAQSGVPH